MGFITIDRNGFCKDSCNTEKKLSPKTQKKKIRFTSKHQRYPSLLKEGSKSSSIPSIHSDELIRFNSTSTTGLNSLFTTKLSYLTLINRYREPLLAYLHKKTNVTALVLLNDLLTSSQMFHFDKVVRYVIKLFWNTYV